LRDQWCVLHHDPAQLPQRTYGSTRAPGGAARSFDTCLQAPGAAGEVAGQVRFRNAGVGYRVTRPLLLTSSILFDRTFLNKIACYLLQRYPVAIRVPAPCLKTSIIPTLCLKTRIAPPLYGLPYARATHDAWYTCTAAIDPRNGRGAHTHRCMPQPLIQISQGRRKSTPITSAQNERCGEKKWHLVTKSGS
jgi:hypothetical protein